MSRGERFLLVKGKIKSLVDIESIVHSQKLFGNVEANQIGSVYAGAIVGNYGGVVDVSQVVGVVPASQLAPHTHAIANVVGLSANLETVSAELANRSLVGHVHGIGDVVALQGALDAKADLSYVQAGLIQKQSVPVTPANVVGLDLVLQQQANAIVDAALANGFLLGNASVQEDTTLNLGQTLSLSVRNGVALDPFRALQYTLSLANRSSVQSGSLEVALFSECNQQGGGCCRTTVDVAWDRTAPPAPASAFGGDLAFFAGYNSALSSDAASVSDAAEATAAGATVDASSLVVRVMGDGSVRLAVRTPLDLGGAPSLTCTALAANLALVAPPANAVPCPVAHARFLSANVAEYTFETDATAPGGVGAADYAAYLPGDGSPGAEAFVLRATDPIAYGSVSPVVVGERFTQGGGARLAVDGSRDIANNNAFDLRVRARDPRANLQRVLLSCTDFSGVGGILTGPPSTISDLSQAWR